MLAALVAIVSVAAFGWFASPSPALAQATKVCTPVGALVLLAGGTVQCTLTATVPSPPEGSYMVAQTSPTITVQGPVTCVSLEGNVTVTATPNGCLFVAFANEVNGTFGTETFTIGPNSYGCLSQAITVRNDLGNSTFSGQAVVTGPGACVGTPLPPPAPNGELKTCTNILLPGGGLGVASGTNFTLPTFSSAASVCTITLLSNGVACSATNPCPSGTVQVGLSADGAAVIACPAGAAPSGPGACISQDGGMQLLLPCGQPLSPATAATCTSVSFVIQAALSACMSGVANDMTNCPAAVATNSAGSSASVTVSWNSASDSGGSAIVGQNVFTFAPQGPVAVGVGGSLGAIPSNGTQASLVTAGFTCGAATVATTSAGFPLSALFAGTTSASGATFAINQPILGLSGAPATCGAGPSGTFTFTSPGSKAIFDNGRGSESVPCGLDASENLFGGSSLFNPDGRNRTAPLALTCTGAAVLVMGNGDAGEAEVDVSYTSDIGGLTGGGATAITLLPSEPPQLSTSCSPSTIRPGDTGILCTARVSDSAGNPLSGDEGATLTWQTSDTDETAILPCTMGVGNAINVTVDPNTVPQIIPNTPCNPPSGTIPGQSTPFVNGQTSALLVAFASAKSGTVTVSAVLGVLVPPEYACEVSPYTPVAQSGTSPGSPLGPLGLGTPGLTGCGAGNPVGFTGLASALSTAGTTPLNGVVTMPNASSASAAVTITATP